MINLSQIPDSTDIPLLKFVAILEGTVASRDEDTGENVSPEQIQEILENSLNQIVSNGGITGDTSAVTESHEALVRVELSAPGDSDESVLVRLERQEIALVAAGQWRTKALDLTTRNDHVESALINLIECWRKGDALDAAMRAAEQLLQVAPTAMDNFTAGITTTSC
ncbi:hypothetical protein [Pseudomonas baetica]|uniref:hypothetical protein n=1 Tax=Pseudomonas baetica TaxID=674054 RepID=UPI0024052766|nr:hypothetical protein [Pseudomonas baetica]MDF9779040.1 hypothetical protein [Pseudomonas baetica]